MIIIALFVGIAYGYISVKGQFCMNSGFSNVIRKKDTTKLKSFFSAILIQMIVLPLMFCFLYLNDPESLLLANIGLPPLFLVSTIIGGFLFGVFMYYTAGCGAGIFYKIGEKNSGAILAAIGFVAGVYFMEKGFLQDFRESSQQLIAYNQTPFWEGKYPLIVAIATSILSLIVLIILYKRSDAKPGGAVWGWKKTGLLIGFVGVLGWISALLANSPYGLAIIPGTMDMVDLNYTWGLMLVIGIPIGAFISSYGNKEKSFKLPTGKIVVKRLFGGLGLGLSGSLAAGCTVGHGLTFTPLLGIGSLVGIFFIFLGSGFMGYLTRK